MASYASLAALESVQTALPSAGDPSLGLRRHHRPFLDAGRPTLAVGALERVFGDGGSRGG
jgi:hypothetical protein